MKSFLILILFSLFLSCSKTAVNNPNCRFLLDLNINEVVSLNLPQFNQLQFAGNSVYIQNTGNAGVIIAFTGSDFFAWDAADPNHTQSACSVLANSGLTATCGCEDKNEYSLVTGQSLGNETLQCTLRNYRVEKSGNTLLITN